MLIRWLWWSSFFCGLPWSPHTRAISQDHFSSLQVPGSQGHPAHPLLRVHHDRLVGVWQDVHLCGELWVLIWSSAGGKAPALVFIVSFPPFPLTQRWVFKIYCGMHRVTSSIEHFEYFRHCLVYSSKCFTGLASPPGLHCTQGSSLSLGSSQNSLHEEEKQTMVPLRTSRRRNCLRTWSCLVIGRASSLSNGRSISSVACGGIR